MYFSGIDIGSTMTKAVLIDMRGEILSVIKGPTGPEHRQLANEVMKMALDQANLRLDDISYIVATCYGRLNVPFADRQITELTCHSRGVSHLFPNAQTEVVSHLSNGNKLEDIIAGLHDALASRVAGLVRRLKIEPDVVLTGGVGKNIGLVKAMKENLDCELLIPEDPLLTGALGAAILAKENSLKAGEKRAPVPRKQRRLEKATFFH